jgi:hypothetical protein
MKTRVINVNGFDVEIVDFGYAKYMYPAFNGNAEFRVSKAGFKQLRHYLRTIAWINENFIL